MTDNPHRNRYYKRTNWDDFIGHKMYVVLWKWSAVGGWESITGDGHTEEDWEESPQIDKSDNFVETNKADYEQIRTTVKA